MADEFGFRKYRDAILSNLQNQDSLLDLDVMCSDGVLKVHGTVFASLIPALRGLGSLCVEDCSLILPDITTSELSTFLQYLYNTKLKEFNRNAMEILREISSTLGYTDFDMETPQDQILVQELQPVEEVKEVIESHDEPPVKEETKGSSKTSALTLAQINIDSLTDEVLGDNFCDQEGRLVCLVCYRLHGPTDHVRFRAHIREHERADLDRVTITIPGVGKGGPGLRKKVLTDTELEQAFGDLSGLTLVCSKCDKQYPMGDKQGFRKHLSYHNLKEKKYLYQCPKCPLKFTDNSNLKRHIVSIHDRQVFRCLHCDFEDNRKKRLQDHMNNAHNDRVQEETEEMSLVKGESSAVIADLSASDAPLSTFNAADDSDAGVFLDSKRSSPNILQKYSYQCTGCKFRKRKLAGVEDHIKESHPDTPDLPIRKIALRAKDGNEQTFACKLCDASFKKRTLLNQHNYKVHELQLDTEHTCGQCGVSCANLPGLRAHTRAHLAKRFLCANCNKSFLILAQLKDHVDKGVCTEKNRKCSVCNKVFAGKHHLELHMRLHNNERPYECDICKKSFTQNRSLKEHKLTHKSERQFKCQHCDKKFVQKNHLKYHLTSQHSQAVSDIPKHTCKTCGKAFPFPYQLKRHAKTHVNNPHKIANRIPPSILQTVMEEANIADVEILSSGAFPDLSQFSQTPVTVVLPDFPLDAASLTDISNLDLDAAMKSVN